MERVALQTGRYTALAAAYPGPGAMGVLSLEVLRLDTIGEPNEDGSTACVTLRWEVVASSRVSGGHAVVVMRRIAGAWCMTHDATVPRGEVRTPGP